MARLAGGHRQSLRSVNIFLTLLLYRNALSLFITPSYLRRLARLAGGALSSEYSYAYLLKTSYILRPGCYVEFTQVI